MPDKFNDAAQSFAAKQLEEMQHDISPEDYAKLYEAGLAAFRLSRFTLVRNAYGAHCGHDAYVRSKPKPINGIEYPSWFHVLKLIDTPEDEALLASALYTREVSSDVQSFWAPLTTPTGNQHSTPLFNYVARLCRVDENLRKQNEALAFEQGIQIDNFTQQVAASEQAPRAFIPPRDWFAPAIQQLSFADVFTLWPDSELDMLKLILGRAWLGRSNSRLVGRDKPVVHTFRSVGIIVGEDPGLGKSTIFDKLARATNATGYRWSNFRNIGEQFGLADIASSDVAYKDDLTGNSLAAFIGAENTKIIASGGRLYAEDKFQKGSSLYSNCVLLANVNEWNPRSVYSLDPGVIDRIKLLSTFRLSNLERECQRRSPNLASPSFKPMVHLPWLATELGVSQEAILLWACRLAVDEFEQYTCNEGDIPDEGLRDRVHLLTARLECNFNKDSAKSIICCMMLAHALARSASVRNRYDVYEPVELSEALLQEMLACLQVFASDAGCYQLRSLVKMHWLMYNRAESHPWVAMKRMRVPSIDYAVNELSYKRQAKQGLAEQVAAVFGTIQFRDGFTGSKDIVWVTKAWQSCRSYAEDIGILAKQLVKLAKTDDEGLNESYTVLASLAHSAFTKDKGSVACNNSWLSESSYSPTQVETVLPLQSQGFNEDTYKAAVEAMQPWKF